MFKSIRIRASLGALGLVGCATVDPKPDYDRAALHMESATGQQVSVAPEDDAGAVVEELLRDGLTSDEAVKVCLLNNPTLAASYLRIGVARANVVQSGLFANPGFGLSTRFPDGGGLVNLEVSLSQNIADLWRIPHRKRAAERDMDRTILTVAREASIAALETRKAYLRAVQADRAWDIARENVTIAQQFVDMTAARRQAGSGTEVETNLARAERVSLDVDARRAQAARIEARTKLAEWMGVATPPHELFLVDPLPDAVDPSCAAEDLIRLAGAHRLDLRAADELVRAAEARWQAERANVWKNVEIGVSMERSERGPRGDRDWLAETSYASLQGGQLTPPSLQPREDQSSDYVTGPTLSAEIPLFDQNQAAIARAHVEWLQARRLQDALRLAVAQESWRTTAQVRATFDNARFTRDELLPLREEGLSLAREAYRLGSGTVLTVLEAQRSLLSARATHIEALVAANEARLELERIAGRPLPATCALPPDRAGETPTSTRKEFTSAATSDDETVKPMRREPNP